MLPVGGTSYGWMNMNANYTVTFPAGGTADFSMEFYAPHNDANVESPNKLVLDFEGSFEWTVLDGPVSLPKGALVFGSVPANGTNGVRIIAFGGDFGDRPNDGQFVMNGCILSDRSLEPAYWEIKHVYQPVSVTFGEDGKSFTVFNKQFFRGLDVYDASWRLVVNGRAGKPVRLDLDGVGPRESRTLPIPCEVLSACTPGRTVSIRFAFAQRRADGFLEPGYVVADDQLDLPNAAETALKVPAHDFPQPAEDLGTPTFASYRLVSASSQQGGGEKAQNAFDGNPDSIWHSRYSPDADDYPHTLVCDLGSAKQLSGLYVLPRQDGKINGRVKGFRIEVSGDGKDWTQVAAGELPDTDDGTTVTFESVPGPAKFVRFTALSPRFGGRWASFADLQPQFK